MNLEDIEVALGRTRSTVEGWGMATRSEAVVRHPESVEDLQELFQLARKDSISVGFRGTGCSYGDASQNARSLVIDLCRFNNIKSLDPETGILVAEPGVTLEQIWRQSVTKGYWPPVVSGTMYPTLGGLLSMNVHGKNNWKHGTIGEHVQSFRILTIDGEEILCSPAENVELFRAAISGFGMLGCFTEVTLKLKKIYSGDVEVTAVAIRNLGHMIAWMDQHREDFDYLVGWIDCFTGGKSLGRGELHAACYVKEGDDPDPRGTMQLTHQDLPSHLLGVFPKAWMWRCMKPIVNDFGMRALNAAKYFSACRNQTKGSGVRQAHAAFNFLLDYVPDWKKAYLPGGLIQYQSFVPADKAHEVHGHLIQLCHRSNLIPYLGVYKRHKPDPFLLTHAVDGFSFAMDFKVTTSNRDRLWDLCHRMDDVVLDAGGRFYFAKDATLDSETAHRIWPKEDLQSFHRLKQDMDPQGLLQTSLSRRLFPEFEEASREVASGVG
jgi:decaprenylphospho-beta-D-ribofuranose 2-oxidase